MKKYNSFEGRGDRATGKPDGEISRLEKQREDRKADLNETIREARHEVKLGMKEAKRELRRQEKNHLREINDRLDETGSRPHEYGDDYEERVDSLRERARDIKKEIRAEARAAKLEIEGRSERFDDGVEKIRNDIENRAAHARSRISATSPMDAYGDYRAGDPYGTVNNYADRIETHAGMTQERMQQDAARAAEDMQERLRDLKRKY